jgi:hypothetical protein
LTTADSGNQTHAGILQTAVVSRGFVQTVCALVAL